jgi:hypothetical protein
MAEAQEKWKEDGCPKIQLGNMKIELPLHLLSPVAIAGAAAGIAATLACHPLEVIKVIVGSYSSVHSTVEIILHCFLTSHH